MTDKETIAKLAAELEAANRAKECFQRVTRAHWEALCAMRNSINEYIPMPNTDSGPLFSPENGPIYADIAERVITDLKDGRSYALALECELKDRTESYEAEIARLQSALPRAWEMGRDAAAHEAYVTCSQTRHVRLGGIAQDNALALTPPADLAKRVKDK